MSPEMILSAVNLGVLGLVAMLLSNQISATNNRMDRLETKVDGLVQSQHQDYKDLSSKIEQVLRAVKSREPA